ncbi:MAG: MarR family transcriptional regulator [Chloroflexota bacterium]
MDTQLETTKTPESKLFDLLSSINHLRLGKAVLGELDLSFSQMALLRWVATSPGCHVQEIADGLELTAPTVSVAIRRLVEAGLLDRCPDPNDKRAACISLSDQGKELQERFLDKRQAEVRRLMSGLTNDEQNQLLHLLQKAFNSIMVE